MGKNVKAMCVFVLIAGLLFGCSKSTGKTSTPAGSSGNLNTTTTTSTLTVMMPATNNANIDKAFDKSKKLFEAAHPGVTVNIIRNIAFANYQKTIETRHQQGNPPDVYQVYPAMAVDYNKAGLLADLNPFIKSDNLPPDRFFKDINDMTSINGKLLYLAISSIPYEVIYSKKWFDKANVPYPKDGWTWEEAIDTAKKLYAANGDGAADKYGLIIPDFISYIEAIVMSKGGSFLSPDGSKATGYLNGNATVDTFQWLHDLYHKQKVSPVMKDGQSFRDAINMIDKKTGIVFSSHSTINDFINSNPSMKQDLGVVGAPKFKDGVRASSMFLTGLGISSGSKNAKLAWEYLRLVALDKNDASIDFFNLGVNSSKILADEAKNDPFQTTRFNEMPYVKKNADQSNKNWTVLLGKGLRARLETILATENIDIQSQLTTIANELDGQLTQ